MFLILPAALCLLTLPAQVSVATDPPPRAVSTLLPDPREREASTLPPDAAQRAAPASRQRSLRVLALTLGVGNASQSHFHILTRLSERLVTRGHHVTMPLQTHMRSISELVEVIPYGSSLSAEQFEANTMNYMRELVYGNVTIKQIKPMLQTTVNECDVMLADVALHQTLRARRFDVAIVDHIFNCGFLYARRLGVPVIGLECAGMQSALTDTVDPFPLAYVPVDMSGLTHRMSFMERAQNAAWYWAHALLSPRMMYAPYGRLQEKYGVAPGEKLAEIKRETRLWVINQCWALNYPRPLLPDVVPAGGLLTRPARPLSQDWESLYEEAGEAGVVLVSFGSYLTLETLPDLERALLAGLGSLSQTVIYRARHHVPDPPPNVHVRDYIPQNDLLGHPKTRVAVLHGGVNGVYEAMYHAVPCLIIPTGFDAIDNALRLRDKGMARIIRPYDVTADDVHAAITDLLTNQSYRQRAQRVSAIFHDQPQHPLEKAVFWVEHVMRHVDENYLRPAGSDLSMWQLCMYDVTALYVAIIMFFLLVVYTCLQYPLRTMKTMAKSKVD